MKNIKITILILIAFLVGAYSTSIYASSNRLIMVPEYIRGYSTLDLLNYMAKQKAKEDNLIIQNTVQAQPVQPVQNNQADTKKETNKNTKSA